MLPFVPFRRVAIIGLGLIGGSFGLAARAQGVAKMVVGYDTDPLVGQRATLMGAVDKAARTLAACVRRADLVVLAAPPSAILEILPRLPPLLLQSAIVTDIASVKTPVVAAAQACFRPGVFTGGHPMAGSEKSGIDGASGELFRGAVWAWTPPTELTQSGSYGLCLQTLQDMVGRFGARSLVLSPQEHDRIVAVTSHLPHVLAYALFAQAVEAAKDAPDLFTLAAGSFSSAVRVAASPPSMWRDICLANRDALLPALQNYQARLGEMASALERGDAAALETLFTKGRREA